MLLLFKLVPCLTHTQLSFLFLIRLTWIKVTIASAVIILILFFGELFSYRAVHVESSLVVDSVRKEKMDIDFDITFRKIPCYSIFSSLIVQKKRRHTACHYQWLVFEGF